MFVLIIWLAFGTYGGYAPALTTITGFSSKELCEQQGIYWNSTVKSGGFRCMQVK